MYDMSIAALSVNMSSQQLSQDMGVSVLKMAMDTAESGATELLDELPAVDPNLGTTIDIMA